MGVKVHDCIAYLEAKLNVGLAPLSVLQEHLEYVWNMVQHIDCSIPWIYLGQSAFVMQLKQPHHLGLHKVVVVTTPSS